VRLIRDPVSYHGGVIRRHDELAEAAPRRSEALVGRPYQKPSDNSVSHSKVADFGAGFLDEADRLVPEQKWEMVSSNAREMTADYLPVCRVAM